MAGHTGIAGVLGITVPLTDDEWVRDPASGAKGRHRVAVAQAQEDGTLIAKVSPWGVIVIRAVGARVMQRLGDTREGLRTIEACGFTWEVFAR